MLEFALSGAYPNPFNPSTTIAYTLPAAGEVRLEVFDIAGRSVAVLARGVQNAGAHALTWNAAGLPSGVYLCRLQASGLAATQKVLLLK